MTLPIRKKIDDVAALNNISIDIIIGFIQEQWIIPIDEKLQIFDEEDIARMNLINELREDFGVNNEGIAIILHLIDQLNCRKNIDNKKRGSRN